MTELIGESITVEYNGVTLKRIVTGVSFDPVMWGPSGEVARMGVELKFRNGGYVTLRKGQFDEMVSEL